ncbi:MAG: LptF/LptG family permease [Thermodesulfobacteriota bacterium]|nr:LptF/LptG family permease [Thermodesulfobacteriota bacterium]
MRSMTLFGYIIKKAAIMWVSTLAGIVLLVVLSRFFGDMSMFAEHDTGIDIIVKYVAFSIPEVIFWVMPFSLCLGILSAQALFSRYSETIAMQACSISVRQIYMPYIVLGLGVTLIMIGISFYVYPVSQRQADRMEDIYIRNRDVKGAFSVSGGRFKVGDSIYRVDYLDIVKGRMLNVTCYGMDAGVLTSIVTAESARWNHASWEANGVTTLCLDQSSGINTYHGGTTIPLDRGPQDLVMAEPRPEVLTIGELWTYIKRLQQEGISSSGIETAFHSRISFAVSPMIMTLLVLPFGLRFPRTGGIARGIASGVMFGLGYWALSSAMEALGGSGVLLPVVAAWTANAAAVCVGTITLLRKRGTYG